MTGGRREVRDRQRDRARGRWPLDIPRAKVLRSWPAMAQGRPEDRPDGAVDAGVLLPRCASARCPSRTLSPMRLARLHELDEVTSAVAAFEDDRALADAVTSTAPGPRVDCSARCTACHHGQGLIDVEGFPARARAVVPSADGRRPTPRSSRGCAPRVRSSWPRPRSWDDGAPAARSSTRSTPAGRQAVRAPVRRWRSRRGRPCWASGATRAAASGCRRRGAACWASSRPRAGCRRQGTSPASARAATAARRSARWRRTWTRSSGCSR